MYVFIRVNFFNKKAFQIFFKSVVTNVYNAKKLVTLTKEQMMVEATEDPKNNEVSTTRTVSHNTFAQSKPSKPALSAVDMILGEEGADTTLKHNSHEFDSNCQICIRKVAERKAAMEAREQELEEEFEREKERRKRVLHLLVENV